MAPEWAALGLALSALASFPCFVGAFSGEVLLAQSQRWIRDSIGALLRLITIMVLLACVRATFRTVLQDKTYALRLVSLSFISLYVFTTSCGIKFYIAFELSLVPITLLVMG